MTRGVPVRVDAVRRWLVGGVGGVDVVGVGERIALTGGRVAPVVERVCVRYEVVGVAGVQELAVVAKRATPGELVALKCLDVVDPVFPRLIDSGVDEDGPWIVVPFEPGEPIGLVSEPPAAVYAALARLHLRHLGRTDELPAELPRVDEQFLRMTFTGFAPSGIRRAAQESPHLVHDRALELLARFADDERLRLGLELLPATFLHGDVHGDNVIAAPTETAPTETAPTESAPNEAAPNELTSSGRTSGGMASVEMGDGGPRLIDWGSARVGPAMLDVMLAGRRAGVAAYGDAWEAASGAALDGWELATGQAWATAVNNAMFVGAVAERSAEIAELMLDEAEEAIERLGRQLSRRN